jgi:regulation of enolase protein 1 (concanavalin A-like superfamily)
VLKRRRYTTAEIIVDESDWDPMPSATARRERVAVRIEVHEVKLREKVKAAGGRWDPEKRVWHLPMEQVPQLGLEGRVARVDPSDPADRSRAQPEGGV